MSFLDRKRNYLIVALMCWVLLPLVLVNATNMIWKNPVGVWCWNFLCGMEAKLTGFDPRNEKEDIGV